VLLTISIAMTLDDEALIEQYVRDAGALSYDRRSEARSLLEHDPAAAAYATVLRGFYDHLSEEDQRETDPRVTDFVDDLFDTESNSGSENREEAKSTVQAWPFRPAEEAQPTVMAAATDTETEGSRFAVLATLAAEAQNVLVRVVGDRGTGQGRLYVLSDRPEMQAHAVVSFPELDLDLATDSEGHLEFDLPTGTAPEDWAETSALVRSPVAEYRLPAGEDILLQGPDSAKVHCRLDEGTLKAQRLQFQGPSDSTALLLLVAEQPDGDRTLLSLSTETPSRLDVTAETLHLRLYT
jgi:hypothetical protein